MEEGRVGTEVSCGMIVRGIKFSVRLNNGKFEAFMRELGKEKPGKRFDDVNAAIDYGQKWRNHFEKTGDKRPIE